MTIEPFVWSNKTKSRELLKYAHFEVNFAEKSVERILDSAHNTQDSHAS